MSFNSLFFLFFFVFAFSAHWYFFSKSARTQNIFLLFASLIFYSAWDYRFLLLIIFSIIVDFLIGIKIESSQANKKLFLILSLAVNLLILIVFKYFNFFIDSFNAVLSLIGLKKSFLFIDIILPVGISFYTFQTMSYSIDIFRGELKPTKDFIKFATFVSFFPQLVAGPIERARKILPQLSNKRSFNELNAKEGLRKILVGFFKKIVVADSLAPIVENVFDNYTEFSALILLLGLLYFSIQIYCDFSGYSDIAIGLAKLFGINLMENFNYPYFSINIGDFWKRWHISLTTWFRDYLYIPLGGSKKSIIFSLRNVGIVFLISGLWHGANWTFIFWGLVHVAFYLPYFLNKKYPKSKLLFLLRIKNKLLSSILTFFIVMLSWVFFRSISLEDAMNYIYRIFSFQNGNMDFINPMNNLNAYFYLIYILFFMLLDKYFSLNIIETKIQNRLFNTFLILIILFFIQMDTSESFIYFQF